MTETPRPALSYCITCKNRLPHLQATLPHNLRVEQDNPDIEFLLLNYDSQDGLAEWIQLTFPDEISSGRLVHAHHRPAPTFRMAHAKNMAHRAASGRILCNLDADNLLVPGFSHWLLAQFQRDADIVVSPRGTRFRDFLDERYGRRASWRRPWIRGIGGRIAIERQRFDMIGGYDETFSAWGQDDIDLLLRARDMGVKPVRVDDRFWGEVLQHDDESRLMEMSQEDRAISIRRMTATSGLRSAGSYARAILQTGRHRANSGGQPGAGNIVLNFADH